MNDLRKKFTPPKKINPYYALAWYTSSMMCSDILICD